MLLDRLSDQGEVIITLLCDTTIDEMGIDQSAPIYRQISRQNGKKAETLGQSYTIAAFRVGNDNVATIRHGDSGQQFLSLITNTIAILVNKDITLNHALGCNGQGRE